MRVNYVGAAFDGSGYGTACRNNIGALDSVGVEVCVNPLTFEDKRPELGKLGSFIQDIALKGADLGQSNLVTILHLTPDVYPQISIENQYVIGYVAWETDRLPGNWVSLINQHLDEVWCPCVHNREAFIRSGVTKPITVVPHCFSEDFSETGGKHLMKGTSFKFLDIFQWTERKDPASLIKAYLTEFRNGEDVSLNLKTYMRHPDSKEENEYMKQVVKNIKDSLKLNSYPPINLITGLLSNADMEQLYKDSDCFISLHRGEGFCVPAAEAMLMGKPVITTNWSGTADFVKEDTGYPVKYMETPVFGMPWSHYSGDQIWVQADILDARKKMRVVFDSRNETNERALAGQKFIKEKFSWLEVGNLMKGRLAEILGDRKE